MVKTGSFFEITMNEEEICSFTADYCDTGENFYLNLFAELSGGMITFRRVRVSYSGTMFETY